MRSKSVASQTDMVVATTVVLIAWRCSVQAYNTAVNTVASPNSEPAEARFKLVDRNDDGKITFKEFKGKRETAEEIEEAEQRFKRIDTDGDKELTLAEYKAAQEKRQPEKSAKKKFQPERLQSAENK